VKQQNSGNPSTITETELNAMLDKFQQRFTGIGKAIRGGEEIQIKISMKDDAIPIAQTTTNGYQLT
jgi:hypothetical protein